MPLMNKNKAVVQKSLSKQESPRKTGKQSLSFMVHINILLWLQISADAKIVYVAKWLFYFAAHGVCSI